MQTNTVMLVFVIIVILKFQSQQTLTKRINVFWSKTKSINERLKKTFKKDNKHFQP